VAFEELCKGWALQQGFVPPGIDKMLECHDILHFHETLVVKVKPKIVQVRDNTVCPYNVKDPSEHTNEQGRCRLVHFQGVLQCNSGIAQHEHHDHEDEEYGHIFIFLNVIINKDKYKREKPKKKPKGYEKCGLIFLNTKKEAIVLSMQS
jgi:hypothetical protein